MKSAENKEQEVKEEVQVKKGRSKKLTGKSKKDKDVAEPEKKDSENPAEEEKEVTTEPSKSETEPSSEQPATATAEVTTVVESFATPEKGSPVSVSGSRSFTVSSDKYERTVLPFEQVETHESFPNLRTDMIGIKDLAYSIKDRGLQNPILVWEHKLDEPADLPWGRVDKRFFVIAGFRRISAIQQIRMEEPTLFSEIPVSIFRGSFREAVIENMIENVQREDCTLMEIGTQIGRLVEMGMTITECADVVGKTRPWASLAHKLANGEDVCDLLQKAVRERKLNAWTALEIAKKPKEQQLKIVRAVYDAYKDGKNEKEVRELVEKMGGTSKRRNVRGVGELREQLQSYLSQDMGGLDQVQVSHLYGIMKGLFWALNFEIDMEAIDIEDWLPEEYKKPEEKPAEKPAEEKEE